MGVWKTWHDPCVGILRASPLGMLLVFARPVPTQHPKINRTMTEHKPNPNESRTGRIIFGSGWACAIEIESQ